MVQKGLQCLWRQKRNVAGQQQERTLGATQRDFCLKDRMSGSQLWLLHHNPGMSVSHQRLAQDGGLVTDDDRRGAWAESIGRAKHVLDERKAAHAMEHFGQHGVHTGALAGSQDGDVNVHVVGCCSRAQTPEGTAFRL
jgi:hypothetical protein